MLYRTLSTFADLQTAVADLAAAGVSANTPIVLMSEVTVYRGDEPDATDTEPRPACRLHLECSGRPEVVIE